MKDTWEGITDWALGGDAFREWLLLKDGDPASTWARAAALVAKRRLRLWVSAASVPALHAWARENGGLARLRAAWDSVRVFTVDALSASEALAEGDAGLEGRIAHANFKRLAPGGLLVTREPETLARYPDAHTPEAALAAFRSAGTPWHPGAAARIPMLDLQEEYRRLQPRLDRALLASAAGGRYILGPEVGRFEEALAGYLGVTQAVGLSSGTEALVLALRALARVRLGKERFDASDRIITTPFTFVATGDAILRAGATPVFVDIDPATLNLDLEEVRRYLHDPLGKVVGIIPVHLFGHPCPMEGLLELAAKKGLFVLEDVAQAFGGAIGDRKLGSLGHISAFSFFPSKNLGGFGDAGAVATDDGELAEEVRRLMKHGGNGREGFRILGYNARLDTLQAALLHAKLDGVDEANVAREKIALRYIEGLRGVGDIVPPAIPGPPATHVFHQFTLRTGRRERVQAALAEAGIASMIYYPEPLHRMPLFQGRCIVVTKEGAKELGKETGKAVGTARATDGSLPRAEQAAREVLSLPIGPAMEEGAVEAVLSAVRGAFAD